MKAGEQPCPACKVAKKDYDARRRSAPELKVKNRARAVAQGRALSELRSRYPEEYRDLYRFYRQEVWEEYGFDE